MNTYNAKISFKGEGGFTFTLPNYGELTVFNGNDVFVSGLSTSAVESLRALRPLLLEHQLNAKPDGCFKVINLDDVKPSKDSSFIRAYKEPIKTQSLEDLKSELIKSNGPIETPSSDELVSPDNLTSSTIVATEVKKNEPKISSNSKRSTTRKTSKKK